MAGSKNRKTKGGGGASVCMIISLITFNIVIKLCPLIKEIGDRQESPFKVWGSKGSCIFFRTPQWVNLTYISTFKTARWLVWLNVMYCNEVYIKNHHFDKMWSELGEVRKTHFFRDFNHICFVITAQLLWINAKDRKQKVCLVTGVVKVYIIKFS